MAILLTVLQIRHKMHHSVWYLKFFSLLFRVVVNVKRLQVACYADLLSSVRKQNGKPCPTLPDFLGAVTHLQKLCRSCAEA